MLITTTRCWNSLTRIGREQATANKFGIYSTCSPRSSIYILGRSFFFCRPIKKISIFFSPTRYPRQQWPPLQKKNGDHSILFSVQGTGGRPTGPDPEYRFGDQENGSPGERASYGLQVPAEPGIVVQTRPPPGEIPPAFFLQNVLQLSHQINIPRWNLDLWKIVNEEDAVFIPKNRGKNFSRGFLNSKFWGQGDPLCIHSIKCLRVIVI
jgi:hypothetical protein